MTNASTPIEGREDERKFLARLTRVPTDARVVGIRQGYVVADSPLTLQVDRLPPLLRVAFSTGEVTTVAMAMEVADRLVTAIGGPVASSVDLDVNALVVRLRLNQPGRPELTVKQDLPGEHAGVARMEENIPLESDLAEQIYALTSQRIDKTRVKAQGWDIDRFHGALEGLVMAEAEYDPRDGRLPDPPDGLLVGPEVSADRAFRNESLGALGPGEARALMARVRGLWPSPATRGR